ncbi:MAG TPA: hypothetical protein VH372_20650 [Actinospica sp.]|nr:hypothetical protein [Actinospica sp.]
MAFHEVLSALRARWYLAVAVLLCVAAAGAYVLHGKPAYQATAAIVLVPPRSPAAPNTLAAATPSIAAAGLAVDDILLSPAMSATLRAQGVVDVFTIVPRNNGTTETPAYRVPTEQITVTGGSAAAVLSEAATLMTDFATQLRAMQSEAGVVARAQITDGVLALPTDARLQGSRSRGAVAIGLLGLGAAVTVSVRFRPGRRAPGRSADASREPGRAEEIDVVVA